MNADKEEIGTTNEEKATEDIQRQTPRSNFGIYVDTIFKHLQRTPSSDDVDIFLDWDMDDMKQDDIEKAVTSHHRRLWLWHCDGERNIVGRRTELKQAYKQQNGYIETFCSLVQPLPVSIAGTDDFVHEPGAATWLQAQDRQAIEVGEPVACGP
jgi:hypothetical protein